MTLLEGWESLIGATAVRSITSSVYRQGHAAAADGAAAAGAGAGTGARASVGAGAGVGDEHLVGSGDVGAPPVLAPLSEPVAHLLNRAHVSREQLANLVSQLPRATTVSLELLRALGLPSRFTTGALHVTEDDVRNWADALRRADRGGVPVDEHMLNVLLGEYTAHGWCKAECSMDAQVS